MAIGGVIGFIAILAIMIGNIVTSCILWSSIESINPTATPDGITFTIMRMLMMIGFSGETLLFTFLTFRAKVFPYWIVALLVIMLLMVLPVKDNKYFAFFWGWAIPYGRAN